MTHVYMKTLRPINRKKGKATNPEQLFFLRKEKIAAQVGFEPTTHCLLGYRGSSMVGSNQSYIHRRSNLT